MKSAIKRRLFWGFSFFLLALTARRIQQEREIEGSLAAPGLGSGGRCRLNEKGAAGNGKSQQANGDGAPTGKSHTTVTFNGIVVRNGSRFALRETAGILYPLDSAGRAWSFEGEKVKVTGKIDLSTRLLHVDAIESAVV